MLDGSLRWRKCQQAHLGDGVHRDARRWCRWPDRAPTSAHAMQGGLPASIPSSSGSCPVVNAPALPAGNTRPDKRFGDSAGVVPRPGVLVVAFEPPRAEWRSRRRRAYLHSAPRLVGWVAGRTIFVIQPGPSVADPDTRRTPLRPLSPERDSSAVTRRDSIHRCDYPMVPSSHLARRVGAARPELCR